MLEGMGDQSRPTISLLLVTTLLQAPGPEKWSEGESGGGTLPFLRCR